MNPTAGTGTGTGTGSWPPTWEEGLACEQLSKDAAHTPHINSRAV
jgi:hypothetical protein